MSYKELFSEHGLSLDRLRSFLEVVDAGNIVKAAGGDSNKQSQYSRQIKELEAFFGAELTTRKGRRITITEEGERLSRLIRSSFENLSDFRADSRNEPHRAVIAGGASIIEWILAPQLPKCRQALGSPILETRSMRSADIIRALDDRSIHFGVLREDAAPPSVSKHVLGEIEYRLFLPTELNPGTPPKSHASWEKLFTTLPLARPVEGGRLRSCIDEAFQSSFIRPQIIAECTSMIQQAAMVQHGHCAAILPMTARATLGEHIRDITLTGFLDYRRTLCLVYKGSVIEQKNWDSKHTKSLTKTLKLSL